MAVVTDALGRSWDDKQHPRGRDGRFIRKFKLLHLFKGPGGDPWATARAEEFLPDGSVRARVTAVTDQKNSNYVGHLVDMDPSNLESVNEKATLAAPGKSPASTALDVFGFDGKENVPLTGWLHRAGFDHQAFMDNGKLSQNNEMTEFNQIVTDMHAGKDVSNRSSFGRFMIALRASANTNGAAGPDLNTVKPREENDFADLLEELGVPTDVVDDSPDGRSGLKYLADLYNKDNRGYTEPTKFDTPLDIVPHTPGAIRERKFPNGNSVATMKDGSFALADPDGNILFKSDHFSDVVLNAQLPKFAPGEKKADLAPDAPDAPDVSEADVPATDVPDKSGVLQEITSINDAIMNDPDFTSDEGPTAGECHDVVIGAFLYAQQNPDFSNPEIKSSGYTHTWLEADYKGERVILDPVAVHQTGFGNVFKSVSDSDTSMYPKEYKGYQDVDSYISENAHKINLDLDEEYKQETLQQLSDSFAGSLDKAFGNKLDNTDIAPTNLDDELDNALASPPDYSSLDQTTSNLKKYFDSEVAPQLKNTSYGGYKYADDVQDAVEDFKNGNANKQDTVDSVEELRSEVVGGIESLNDYPEDGYGTFIGDSVNDYFDDVLAELEGFDDNNAPSEPKADLEQDYPEGTPEPPSEPDFGPDKSKYVLNPDGTIKTVPGTNQPMLKEDDSTADGIVDASAWVKTGSQSGSNTGGVYTDADGNQYYVKKGKSTDHVFNEAVASKLYEATGVNMVRVDMAHTPYGPGTSSPIQPITSDLKEKLNDPDFKKKVQEGFATDAWLANWDVRGLVYDNLVSDADGNPLRVDPGGSLSYRAQGAPKGSLFGEHVGETDTFFDPANGAHSLFGGMSVEDQKASVQKVLDVSPEQIDSIVDGMPHFDGVNDTAERDKLKTILKARRANLADQYGMPLPENGEPAIETPDIIEPPEMEKTALPDAVDKSFTVLDDPGDNGDGYYAGGSGLWGKYGAAGAMIRHVDDDGVERFLMVQRGPIVSSNKGKWQLPGGALNSNENDYQGTARELSEELEPPEGFLDTITPHEEVKFEHPSGWHYTNIPATVPEQFDAKVDGTETGDAGWFTREEIANLPLHPALEKNLDDIYSKFPMPEKKTADTPQEDVTPNTPEADAPPVPTPDVTPDPGKKYRIDKNNKPFTVGDTVVWDKTGEQYKVIAFEQKYSDGVKIQNVNTGQKHAVKMGKLETQGPDLQDWEKELLDYPNTNEPTNGSSPVNPEIPNESQGFNEAPKDWSGSLPETNDIKDEVDKLIESVQEGIPYHMDVELPNGWHYSASYDPADIHGTAHVTGPNGEQHDWQVTPDTLLDDDLTSDVTKEIEKTAAVGSPSSPDDNLPDITPEDNPDWSDGLPDEPTVEATIYKKISDITIQDDVSETIQLPNNHILEIEYNPGSAAGMIEIFDADTELISGQYFYPGENMDDVSEKAAQIVMGTPNAPSKSQDKPTPEPNLVSNPLDMTDSVHMEFDLKMEFEFLKSQNDPVNHELTLPDGSKFVFKYNSGDSYGTASHVSAEGDELETFYVYQHDDNSLAINNFVGIAKSTAGLPAAPAAPPPPSHPDGKLGELRASIPTSIGGIKAKHPGIGDYQATQFRNAGYALSDAIATKNEGGSDWQKAIDKAKYNLQQAMPYSQNELDAVKKYEADLSESFGDGNTPAISNPADQESPAAQTISANIADLGDIPDHASYDEAAPYHDAHATLTNAYSDYMEGISSAEDFKNSINEVQNDLMSKAVDSDQQEQLDIQFGQMYEAVDELEATKSSDYVPSAPTPTAAPEHVDKNGIEITGGSTVKWDKDGQNYTVLKFEANGTGLVMMPVGGGQKKAVKKAKVTNINPGSTLGEPTPAPVATPTTPNTPDITPNTSVAPSGESSNFPSQTPSSPSTMPPPNDPAPQIFVPKSGGTEVDTSDPLYGAPKPEKPPYPPLNDDYVPDGWIEEAKQLYADAPSTGSGSLEQSSITWGRVQAVAQNGDRAALKKLLERNRITQKMYDDADKKISIAEAQNMEITDAYDTELADYETNVSKWASVNGIDNTIVPGEPKLSNDPFLGGDADWTKAPVGTASLKDTMDAMSNADPQLATRGMSIAADSGDIEDLDVRMLRVIDNDGEEYIEAKFKLTAWAGDAVNQNIKNGTIPEVKTDSAIVWERTIDPETGLPKYIDSLKYNVGGGQKFIFTDPNSGARIELIRYNTDKTGKNVNAMHNTVRVMLPKGSNPEDFEAALTHLGIKNAKPATPDDVRVLAENKLLSLGGNTDPTYNIMDSDSRLAALKDIKDRYGVGVDDIRVMTNGNGRVKLVLSDEAAQKIVDYTNLRGLSHSMYNGGGTDVWKSMLTSDNPGLHSTMVRWSEGIGAHGQSSSSDMSSGGGEWMFTKPNHPGIGTGATHTAYGNTVGVHPLAAARRLDMYGNTSDHGDGKHDAHVRTWDVMKGQPYEIQLKHSIPLADMHYVSIYDTTTRDSILKFLQEKGITKINGIPVEQFVLSSGMPVPDTNMSNWSGANLPGINATGSPVPPAPDPNAAPVPVVPDAGDAPAGPVV